MKTSVINIKTEEVIKNRAQKLAKELGLSLSTVINASLKQFIQTKEIHLRATHKMTPYLEKLIDTAEKEYRRKKYAGPFTQGTDMDNYLDSV